MNRVRLSHIACVMLFGWLALATARADDRKASDPATATPPVAAQEKQSNIRKFWNMIKGKEKAYPKQRDWTTGRDDGNSKPWLRR